MREIVLDTETTGFNFLQGDRLVEIGCIELQDRLPTGRSYQVYINPERDMPLEAFKIHGLSTEFLSAYRPFRDSFHEFLDFIGSKAPLIIHNARFDMSFINAELKAVGIPQIPLHRAIDTLKIAKIKFPGARATLDALCDLYKIDNKHRTKHGALLDAELLAEVYLELMGGRQSSLNLESISSHSVQLERSSLSSRPKRNFEVSEEEKKRHQEFIKKIKNSLWGA